MGAPNRGYFDWLVRQTGMSRSRNTHDTYWGLLRQLFTLPFRWSIRNDDNREADGRELRGEYQDKFGVSFEDLRMDQPVSVLEVLVGLSRRLEYDTYDTAADWFWKLIENLGMRHFTDANYNEVVEADVQDIIADLLDRRYGRDGHGGLFPLRQARHDQRRVEIGYQLAAYLAEGEYVDNGP